MSADPRAAYDAIAAELVASAGALKGTMFGMPCLKHSGKMFAGFFQDAMVFKLDAPAHAQALALAGARLFDPSDRGRPMKEWVVVPAAHAARWPEFGRAALEYVAELPSTR
jgi:TfoX N-terminal domain